MTVNKAASKKFLANRRIPAIIAVGSSLAALPASALQLGELTLQSRMGQPLRASIAYALAPNELLSDYCVAVRRGPSASGLPGFGAATVSVANGVIVLTGNTPLREPMISAHVVIDCPYSANLSREYMLFLDPLISTQPVTATVQTTPQAEPIAITPAAIERPVTTVIAEPIQKDIATGTSYRVQTGESLSMIARRIENSSVGLWPTVNAIFATNPDAFVNNDPNLLKAGSWLSIPDFNGSAAVVAIAEELPVAEAVLVEEPASAAEPIADMTKDLRPGDIILDTDLEGPTTSSSSPNVPTAIITTESTGTDGSASRSWLIWLAGSGIGLIFALLMFGRRLTDRSGTAPAAPLADQPQQHFDDTQQTTETENTEAVAVDYDLSDDSPTEENLILDADLVMGTGLDQGATSGDSQDFGFAATTALDIELPFEPVVQAADATDATDMLPPLERDVQSILESEVLPEEDDDDYDMSVIVDATKMPRPEDVTERDLKAVEVTPADESLITENYTISKEVDYKVVEQDYEDEMTATQALNEEIARAATGLDITAQMPAQNDEYSDLDDTGINEAITVNTPDESGKASRGRRSGP
jgi:hypothetical protein